LTKKGVDIKYKCEKIKNVSVGVNNNAVGTMEKTVRTDINGVGTVENRIETNNIGATFVEKGFSTVDVE